jgi:soluble lytic murein transglycosylase-like protein
LNHLHDNPAGRGEVPRQSPDEICTVATAVISPRFRHISARPARQSRYAEISRVSRAGPRPILMKILFKPTWLAAIATLFICADAKAQQRADYEKLVALHARANLVPETLVHRVIVRESKYRPDLVGRGGTIGLMQIKLGTARSLGYMGDAKGLRDPDTNLAYGVKYLAGAYRAANGDHDRAVRYFAGGYYPVAKRQRLEHLKYATPDLASPPPKPLLASAPQQEVDAAKAATDGNTEQVPK